MRTETFEQFSQTVAKCHKLVYKSSLIEKNSRMIQFGDADVMVAGGTESSIDALSVSGFSRSRALSTKYNSSQQEASRPFDCGQEGFLWVTFCKEHVFW
ncbi:hypothetical protein F2Q69_00041812 [Brassica cretica]|uniref:beta-ketoacyl-[acyl-carrier-protein] synthase I n=1 Tax=Brassica cretica TaxID=69181 RepID=A0A8S9NL82_BRACR|nr:hypothetical protein F2Q69_00041812 [Brassica cretica]